jgi:MATE family multidrug resistance protein
MNETTTFLTSPDAGPPPDPTQPDVRGVKNPDAYGTILRLALPLILSMSGLMVMVLLNRLFLSWYGKESIAAIGVAGLASYMLMSLFVGAAGFTSTFVAQYIGAGQPERVGVAVWQGIFFSLVSGALVACLSGLARPFFAWVAHDPAVQVLEVKYFTITCWAAPLCILGSALTGFFAGRGETRTLMVVQISGFLLNVGLDYTLIFGKFGQPELGIAGAAWANLIAQGFISLTLMLLFMKPSNRRDFGTGSGCRWDRDLFFRLARFGLPSGARFAFELLAWNSFLVFVGRLGETQNAVTNMVWALNGFAFFPVIGLSEAVRALVGQAQGRGEPEVAARCVWRGLLIGGIWMIAWAAIYLLIPDTLLSFFKDERSFTAQEFAVVTAIGTVLLRFVAVYCLLDAANIVIMGALQGVGDTVWTFYTALVMNVAFLAAMWWVDRMRPVLETNGWKVTQILYLEWGMATAFVVIMAGVWVARFASGHWKNMRVIEEDSAASMAAGPA